MISEKLEQYRLELIKAALQGFCANSEIDESFENIAEFAIKQADAVIIKLENEK